MRYFAIALKLLVFLELSGKSLVLAFQVGFKLVSIQVWAEVFHPISC